MKRKLSSAVLVTAMVLAMFVACSSEKVSSGKSKLTLWASGSTNVDEVFQKLENGFNASQDVYELEVQFIASGGGGQTMRDRVLAAHKADQKDTTYDIIEVGDQEISVFLKEGGDDMLSKIDKSKIANSKNVSAEPAYGQEYVQAYRGTTVVMAYNSDVIDTPPTTMDELVEWMKVNPGRFSYNTASTGGAGDSFIRSSIYNFLPEEAFMSDDEKWINEWDEGFDFLASIHPYMYKSGNKVVYPNKNQGTLDLLINKEIDMCPTWADMAISQIRNGTLPASTKIYQIEPSFTGAVNSFVIPTMGSNPEGAHAFIDYMLSPEAQNILLLQMAAIPLIDQVDLDIEAAKDVAGLDVTNFRTQSIGALGRILDAKWDNEISTLKN